MAKYTDIQAGSFKIIRADKYTVGGEHSHYIFTVRTAKGRAIKWEDKDLAGNASKAVIKTAISDYITSLDKPSTAPATEVDKGVGLAGNKVKDLK